MSVRMLSFLANRPGPTQAHSVDLNEVLPALQLSNMQSSALRHSSIPVHAQTHLSATGTHPRVCGDEYSKEWGS